MGYGLQILTPPASEPVSLEELKQWLRVEQDFTDDDALIASLGKAARRQLEQEFDCCLMQTTFTFTDDRFPRYSSSAVWQYNSDAIWQQRLPVTQLSGQWYPDRASFRLPRPPLQSVVSINYIDGTGTPQLLDPSIYNVDTSRPVGRVAPSYGNIWPIVRQQLAAISVTFVAGYGQGNDASQVPDAFKTAIKLCAANLYEHRGEDASTMAIPPAAERLMLSEWDGEYR